ncbi:MAG: hypothetical protein HQK77_14840 [Desulfobacterales bacterium]|nr:hypothetical protein [Desulfobacterales bacterium]
MSDKRHKILIFDYNSDVTSAAKETLFKDDDVFLVKTLEELRDKTDNDHFDIIITGYLIPELSDNTHVYLENIQKYLDEALVNVQEKKSEADKALLKSNEINTNLFNLLEETVRKLEIEKADLKKQIEYQKQETDIAYKENERFKETVLKEKNEVELKFKNLEQEHKKAMEQLTLKIKSMEAELQNALAIADKAIADKSVAEKKLTKFQEQWENFVKGK